MPWGPLRGHDELADRLRRALARGRLASTFLFVGPPGVGKGTFALRFAQTLLCEARPAERLDPCGGCPGCRMVLERTHPDLEVVTRPKDRSFIPVETFLGDREHRRQEGLCHTISLRPFRGGRRVAIIDDADYLNAEGANCLLKTLEEPPPGAVLILIGTSEQKQLPTIRSRCQILRFAPLPEDVLAELLVAQGLADDPAEAAELAELAEGSLTRAAQLRDPALAEFRPLLLEHLGQADPPGVDFAKALAAFVDAAGKEAPPRRERLLRVLGAAESFYRRLVRGLLGEPLGGDRPLQEALATAVRAWRTGPAGAAAALERCLEAAQQVEASANLPTLIDCFVDDLGQAALRGRRESA